MNIVKTGLMGEWKAERFLKKQGMRVLRRRYQTPHGEIDLILQDGEIIVFAEVKYRPAGQMGDGASAVDMQKQNRLHSGKTLKLVRYLKAKSNPSLPMAHLLTSAA